MTMFKEHMELIGRMKSGAIDRRTALSGLAAFGLGVVTLPVIRRPAMAATELTYFGWAGYDDPTFVESYVPEHGAPTYGFFANEDEAFHKMRQGYKPDVMHPGTYELVKWKDGGLLRPLDPARLEWLDDTFESLLGIEGSIIDGDRYFMPIDWGNSSVLYRRDLVGPEYQGDNESWGILYDEAYKGRTAFYDSAETAVEVAARVLGYENIFSLDDEQLVEVGKLMRKQRDVLRFYWGDLTEVEQAMASGELVASHAWNSGYVNLKKQGLDVAYAVPKEGIFTWCSGLVMHADTEVEDAAYDLINAFASPESGAYEITSWGYGHSNRRAFDLVPAETLSDLGLSTPEALLDNGIFFQSLDPTVEEKYIRLYDDVRAGG